MHCDWSRSGGLSMSFCKEEVNKRLEDEDSDLGVSRRASANIRDCG